HLEERWNARKSQRFPPSNINIFSRVRHGFDTQRVQQRSIGMRTYQQRAGAEQSVVVEARDREESLAVNCGEAGAGQQPDSGNRRIRERDPVTEPRNSSIDFRVTRFSDIGLVPTIESIRVTVNPERRATLVPSLAQGAGSSEESFPLFCC